MSYKNLAVWQLAKDVEKEIRSMVLEEIPKLDMWKEGTELRRAAKNVVEEIVEAYAKKGNKQNIVKYLKSAIEHNDEAIAQLHSLYRSGALIDSTFYSGLHSKMEFVGEQLKEFISTVEREHTAKR